MPAGKGLQHFVGSVALTDEENGPVLKFWYEQHKTVSLTLYSCDGGDLWANSLEVVFRFANEYGKLRLASENAEVDGAPLKIAKGFGFDPQALLAAKA